MTADVALDAVTVRYGHVDAVKDVTLHIAPGEFFSFLGPSGCGKTTLLRAISGFAEPSRGSIRIGGQDMRGVGPNRRPTAMIFQSLALFPGMTVSDNVAYGLRVRGVPRNRRRETVSRLLDIVALAEHGGKRIDALSGGQRQRVAIARALAVEPRVLLLDEPLSSLDLKLRQHMRRELRAIQGRVGLTFIYITHDQGEALTMSDRIAVMRGGKVEQVGEPRAIYEQPRTAFVASFVGETNMLPGRVTRSANGQASIETAAGVMRGRNPRGLGPGCAAALFVRPEAVALAAPYGAAPPARPLAENCGEARVASVAFEGGFTHVALRAVGDAAITATLARAAAPDHGAWLRFGFGIDDAVVLPADA